MIIRALAYFSEKYPKTKKTFGVMTVKEFFQYREPEKYGRYPNGYKVYPIREYQQRLFPNFLGQFDTPRLIRPSPHPSYVFRTPLNLRKRDGEE